MTTPPDAPISGHRPGPAPVMNSLRTHLLGGGAALFTTGALAAWLLPEFSMWWLLTAVFVITHAGLAMIIGGAALRWPTVSVPPPPTTVDNKANERRH